MTPAVIAYLVAVICYSFKSFLVAVECAAKDKESAFTAVFLQDIQESLSVSTWAVIKSQSNHRLSDVDNIFLLFFNSYIGLLRHTFGFILFVTYEN